MASAMDRSWPNAVDLEAITDVQSQPIVSENKGATINAANMNTTRNSEAYHRITNCTHKGNLPTNRLLG